VFNADISSGFAYYHVPNFERSVVAPYGLINAATYAAATDEGYAKRI
jgi:hypothetical protein